MTFNSSLKNLLVLLAFTVAFGCAVTDVNANLLEPSQCYSRDEFKSAMKSENMLTLIGGNETSFTESKIKKLKSQMLDLSGSGKKESAYNWAKAIRKIIVNIDNEYQEMVQGGYTKDSKEKELNSQLKLFSIVAAGEGTLRKSTIIFANDVGEGYLLQGDAPYGEKSYKICVLGVYHGIRIHSPVSANLPIWATQINDRSDKLNLKKSYENGIRLIFGANNKFGNPVIVTVSTNNIARVWVLEGMQIKNEATTIDDLVYAEGFNQFLANGFSNTTEPPQK